MIEIRPILSTDAHLYWPKASTMLSKAFKYTDGEFDLEELFKSIIEQRRALWVVFENGNEIAAITSRVDEYPTGLRVAVIDFAGGEKFHLWKNFTDYISPFYKSLNCDMLEIAGRLGWLRLHTDKGFKIRYYVMRKEL